MDKINILGINISILKKEGILKTIERFLIDGEQHYLVTPNPEIILQSLKDEEYFYILNQADLALADGIGLKLAAWIMGKNIFRVTGADLIKDILKLAENKKLKVAVFNRRGGLSSADEIQKTLTGLFPRLRLVVEEVDREWTMPYYQNINIFQPVIAFVTLGAPWQEKFIYHQLPRMPYIKLAAGVGGGIDFLTGKAKRAPRYFRLFGLEWFWRLMHQPRRWRRIFQAVAIFPLQFIQWRFVRPFLYRSNVACLLFKKEGGKHRILIVSRKNDAGHWQLPQGGTDGENPQSAGIRELSEELGTNNFKPVAVFRRVYKYKFHNELSRGGVPAKYIKGYRGQKQSLFIAEFIGRDSDIKINFWDHSSWRWVDANKLVNEVHPLRKRGAKIFLEKFKEISGA